MKYLLFLLLLGCSEKDKQKNSMEESIDEVTIKNQEYINKNYVGKCFKRWTGSIITLKKAKLHKSGLQRYEICGYPKYCDHRDSTKCIIHFSCGTNTTAHFLLRKGNLRNTIETFGEEINCDIVQKLRVR